MSATNSHSTVELPAGAVIHYSGLDGAAHFACGIVVLKGDWWSQYQSHVTCPRCKEWIKEQEPA